MLRALPVSLYLLICAGLVVGNAVVYRIIFAPPVFVVETFTAGKGIATLVRTPGGATILVDTGSDASILRALGTALPFSQHHIDVVLLTSSHASSTGGLLAIQARYRVGAIAHTGNQVILNSSTAIDATLSGVFLTSGEVVTKIR